VRDGCFVKNKKERFIIKKYTLIAIVILLGAFLTACAELPEEQELPNDYEEYAETELPISPRRTVTGVLEDSAQAWDSISVTSWFQDGQPFASSAGIESTTHMLNMLDAERAFEILSTIEATEILTPFHSESIQSDRAFILEINFADGGSEIIEEIGGGFFFRFTDTRGDHGDLGYVFGISEELREILMTYF